MASRKKAADKRPAVGFTVKQRAFLAAVEILYHVEKSAEAAKVNRTTHYEWLANEKYAAAFENARKIFGQNCEAEARRRAIEGESEVALYKGEPVLVWEKGGKIVPPSTKGAKQAVLHRNKKSDFLLICLLNASMPERFRPRRDEETRDEPEIPPERVEQEILEYLDGENHVDGSDGPHGS